MRLIWVSLLARSLLSLCGHSSLALTTPLSSSSSWTSTIPIVHSSSTSSNSRCTRICTTLFVGNDHLGDCTTRTKEESSETSLHVPLRNSDITSQVYVRFSPLVGGPKLVPIHVEVMILILTTAPTKTADDKTCQCLHRFDFLPAHPTETTTIQKLLSFQSVPGLIRHKIFVNENTIVMENENDLDFQYHEGKNVAISVVPNERIKTLVGNLHNHSPSTNQNNDVFSIQKNTKNKGEDSGLSITIKLIDDAGIQFKKSGMIDSGENDEELEKFVDVDLPLIIPEKIDSVLDAARGKQLHLINNNCYSFSWELLNSLR